MTTTLQELDEVLKGVNDEDHHDDLGNDCISFLYQHHTKIRAALELQAKLEQGYVLVPREPTDEMLDAALRLHPSFSRLAMTVMIEDAINTAPSAGEQDAS